METLADRIRLSRLKSGFSQMELAEQSHLTQQMISKLESGASQSTSAIFAIANTLGVSAQWLWLGKETSPDIPFAYDDQTVNKAWQTLSDQQRDHAREYIIALSKGKHS